MGDDITTGLAELDSIQKDAQQDKLAELDALEAVVNKTGVVQENPDHFPEETPQGPDPMDAIKTRFGEIHEDYDPDFLPANKGWVEAARVIYKFENNQDAGALKDEQLSDWLLDYMGQFNYNLAVMTYETNQLQEADLDTKMALLYAMESYDGLNSSWAGAGRVVKGLATDPTTYVGMGIGALASKGAGAAAKQGIREAVRFSIKHHVPVAAVEGAIYSSAGELNRERVKVEAETQEDVSNTNVAVAAAVGAVAAPIVAITFTAGAGFLRNLFKRTEGAQVFDPQKALKAKAEAESPLPEGTPKVPVDEPTASTTTESTKKTTTIEVDPDVAGAFADNGSRAAKLKEAIELDENTSTRLFMDMAAGRYDEVDALTGFNAGKIDWSRLEDSAEGKKMFLSTLEHLTKAYQEVITKAKKGVQSHEVTKKLADFVGGNMDTVAKLFNDVSDNFGLAARMHSAHRMLIGSHEYAMKLLKTYRATGLKEDGTALLLHIERHALLTAMVKGSQTEIARALNAMKMMRAAPVDTAERGVAKDAQAALLRRVSQRNSRFVSQMDRMQATAKMLGGDPDLVEETLFKLEVENAAKLLETTPTTRELNRALKESTWHKISSKIAYMVTGNLLSGADTMIGVQVVGNVMMNALYGMEKGIMTSLGLARSHLMGQKKGGNFYGYEEYLAWWSGTFSGLNAALKIPVTKLARGDLSLKMALNSDELGTAWKALITGRPQTMSEVDNFTQEVGRNAADNPLVFSAEDVAGMRNWMQRNAALGWNVIGHLYGVVPRVIGSMDELAKAVADHQVSAEIGTRRALQDVLNAQREMAARKARGEKTADIKRKDSIKYLREMAPKYMTNLTDAELKERQDYIAGAVLRDEGSRVIRMLENIGSEYPLLKAFLLPFVRAPIRGFEKITVERTGLGLLSGRVRRQIFDDWKAGGKRRDKVIAQYIIGHSALAAGILLALEGKVRGIPRPTGELDSKDIDRPPEISVQIGDKWVSLSRLEPFSMPLAVAARLTEGHMKRQEDLDMNELERLGALAIDAPFAIGATFIDKAALQGVKNLFLAMNQPEIYGERFIVNGVGMFTPMSNLLRDITAQLDPYQRAAGTAAEGFVKTVPFTASTLPIKRDFFGKPVLSQEKAGPDMLSPIATLAETTNPVVREIRRMSIQYKMPPKRITIDGASLDLNTEQYQRFLQIRGQGAGGFIGMEKILAGVIGSPQWSRLSDSFGKYKGTREDVVKDIIEQCNEAASQILFEEYRDEFMPKLLEEKRREVSVKTGKPIK